jgi:hypothetical protein
MNNFLTALFRVNLRSLAQFLVNVILCLHNARRTEKKDMLSFA